MFDTASSHVDRLHTLSEISRVVSSTLDLRTLYETIYQQVGRVMDTSAFFIALAQPDGGGFAVPYVREDGQLMVDQEPPQGPTVTQLVLESGKPLLFNTEQEFIEFAQANGLLINDIGDAELEPSQSEIFVPLNTGSRTLGVLAVQTKQAHAYTDEDVQTLTVIAAQAAVAIQNAALYAQSEASVRQMQALLHVARTISSSLNLQTVLDAILRGMEEVLPFSIAAVLLPDFSQDRLEVAAAVSPLEPPEKVNRLLSAPGIPFGKGITGTAFRQGEPLLVGDVLQHPNYINHAGSETRSEVAVPLKRGDAVVGLLDVQRWEVNAFSVDDLALLTLFASQAAIAIENARLFTEQQRRVYELQTIQNIVQKLTPLLDIDGIARLIADEVRALIDYNYCRVFFLDEAAQLLVRVGLPPDATQGYLPRVGEGITGWIAQHGQSVLIPNMIDDPRTMHIPGTLDRPESMVGAPLVYEGRVRGVISLTKLGANQFDENALRLLEIIAAQAAIAFDRARLYDELRTDAVTDELTRLYNRRYLLERFKEEKSRAIRNRHNLIAVMLDIDNFKAVNDSYGHDAGDVVLQELAAMTRAVVRAEDIVTRYGGEEFCILLPEIPLADAEQVAERLRLVIARHRMPAKAGVHHITASLGMAILRPDDQDAELFTRADLAMYEVKKRGGNGMYIWRDA